MTVIATEGQTCEVYWIRRYGHSDIFSEGYVGITTKGIKHRYSIHLKDSKKSTYPVHKAMQKYDDVVISVVVIGSVEYCLDIENRLRSAPRIGWNIAVGGSKTMLGYKMSDESRLKISLNNGSRSRVYSEEDRLKTSLMFSGKKHTEESRKKMREIAKARSDDQLRAAIKISAEKRKKLFSNQPWLNPNADNCVWAMADQAYKIYLENPEIGIRALGSILNMKFSKFQCVLKKIKSGWVPTKCPFWIETFTINKESI